MESIALVKNKQKQFHKQVKQLKGKISKGDITVSENAPPQKSSKKHVRKGRGVIYLGSIPHGFYEEEMKSYFSQFGTVTRLRLARSKKTGKSKGYAFIEFLHQEVASVVAETMDNYLMFNRLLKCKCIPNEKLNERMFHNTIQTHNYPKLKNQKKEMNLKNRSVMKPGKEELLRKKKLKQIEDFKRFFEERGIEFNFKVNDPHCDVATQSATNGNAVDPDSSADSSDDEYNDTDNSEEQFGVLEIDESDDEIQFKTPPEVKKVIKRSTSGSFFQTNGKWPMVKLEPKTSKPGKGVIRKFQGQLEVKEKPKLLKSFKPKNLKKQDKSKTMAALNAVKGSVLKKTDVDKLKMQNGRKNKENKKQVKKETKKNGVKRFGGNKSKMNILSK